MKSEIDIICEVCRKLDSVGLSYMLTGSVAMNYYAEPRMTRNIDFVIVIPDENIGRRRNVSIGSTPVSIVSKEDLILSKLFWAKDSHSEMQLRDVQNLMASGYDQAYVAKWKDELGVGNLLKELEHE